MSDNSLRELYELFDELIDLDPAKRRERLEQLQAEHHPLYDQVRNLLDFDASTESILPVFQVFGHKRSLEQWLQSAPRLNSTNVTNDLRELVGQFTWDSKSNCFLIGPYRIGKCLSFNSQSATYFAQDITLGRNVVLTLAYHRLVSTTTDRATFLSSTKIISNIFHPNLATILGVVEETNASGSANVLGVVRQWIPGKDLSVWLESKPKLSLRSIAQIAQRITEGLSAIHVAGAVHGDLKPSNVVMRQNSLVPIITDFGTVFRTTLAKTPQLWRGGTPGYIAPEILQQLPYDSRSDLFSLGRVLIQLLQHVETPSASADDYQQIERLAQQLCDPEPDRRPETCDEVIDSLMTISGLEREELGGEASPEWTKQQSNQAFRSRRILLSAAGAILPFWFFRQWHQWRLDNANPTFPFIPGTKADIVELLRINTDTPGVNFLRLPEPTQSASTAIPENSRRIIYGFLAIPPNITQFEIRAAACHLPSQQIKVNVSTLITYFNAMPGEASCEILVRNLAHSPKWFSIARRHNYFGGVIRRDLIGVVDHDLLIPNTDIEFRVRMSTKRPWDGNGIPPVMIRVKEYDQHELERWEWLLWTSEA